MELCSSSCHQSVISQTILKTMLETNWGELMVVNKVLRQWNPGCPAYAFSAKTGRLPCYPRAKMRTPSPFRVQHWVLRLWVSSSFICWWGAMVLHWWERSPPTNLVWVHIPASMPCVAGLNLLMVLSPASRGFFFLGFPLSSTDTNFLFQFNQEW